MVDVYSAFVRCSGHRQNSSSNQFLGNMTEATISKFFFDSLNPPLSHKGENRHEADSTDFLSSTSEEDNRSSGKDTKKERDGKKDNMKVASFVSERRARPDNATEWIRGDKALLIY